jgi:hypothetical protein
MADYGGHRRGCSRADVRPSHHLPNADVCGTCRRIVRREPSAQIELEELQENHR